MMKTVSLSYDVQHTTENSVDEYGGSHLNFSNNLYGRIEGKHI